MTDVWLHLTIPDEQAATLSARFPDVAFHSGDLPDATLAKIDAAFVTEPIPDAAIEKMPNLRWMHSTYGSVGTIATPIVAARNVALTSSKGTHAVPFAEFTIAAIYAMAKHIPRVAVAQSQHRWDNPLPLTTEVRGTTLGIVGFGAIGSELASAAHHLGIRIVATKLHVEEKPDYVDWIKPPDALPDLLRESDWVVLSIPATPETEGLMGEAMFRLMKPTAVLINLTARNALPNEDLLARALRGGWIGGAVFNVFSGPRGAIAGDSPLWDAPNMLIAPRIPSFDPNRWVRLLDLYCDNLSLFIAGGPLRNLGSAELGY